MPGKLEILTVEPGAPPVFKDMRFDPHEFRDGLLIRSPNWLGDIMMTLPSMLQLRRLLPKYCGLFVQCPRGLAPIFESMDIVDQVFPLSNPHAFLSWSEWNSVRRNHIGAALLFNNSFRDALSLKSAGIPRLYGTGARCRGLLLTGAFPFPPRLDLTLNHPHQGMRYLAMAYALGAPEWQGGMPDMDPRLEPEVLSPELHRIASGEPVLVIAPGAAYGDAKRWAPEKFRTVAAHFLEQGYLVVSVGSGKEAEVAAETLSGLSADKVLNLAGRTSLRELMFVLKHAALILANDSGVMHMGAALNVPGVAVFGSTDYAATGPLSKRWRVVYANPECGPCFRRMCPNGSRACFNAISADAVLNACGDLLRK